MIRVSRVGGRGRFCRTASRLTTYFDELAGAMRVWAKGILCLEAAVGLLIGHGSWLYHQDFLDAAVEMITESGREMAFVDFTAAATRWRRAVFPARPGRGRSCRSRRASPSAARSTSKTRLPAWTRRMPPWSPARSCTRREHGGDRDIPGRRDGHPAAPPGGGQETGRARPDAPARSAGAAAGLPRRGKAAGPGIVDRCRPPGGGGARDAGRRDGPACPVRADFRSLRP